MSPMSDEFRSATSKPMEPAEQLIKLKTSDELIVTDTKELGKAILTEALEREKKARQDKVILEVQRLEQSRMQYINQAKFATEASEWYAKKLNAIQNGDFDFDLTNGQMHFHDPDLEDANY